MTARSLYDRYTDALRATEVMHWKYAEQRNDRVYPVRTPPAWPFLPEREKKTWVVLAKTLRPAARGPRP
jgi:hypothetical protein